MSDDGFQLSVKLVCVSADDDRPEGVEGDCVSAALGTDRQKSSTKRFPVVPLFQVQILALVAPAGTV